MTGSPPLHLALLLVVFIVLSVPLVQLTSAPSHRVMIPSEEVEDDIVAGVLRFRWAHLPNQVTLKCGDLVFYDSKPEGSILEKEIQLKIPDEGVELSLHAEWPANTPDTAITVELEPDGLDGRSETKWSSESRLDDVITFIWKR
ncbi:MAG: hypothetical protein JNJ83_11950 [Verrucomicrobiaceae bacterium]|nr:hypothetical protein [Verrucomicrobiaceae bacterium]